jgi:hypothetical protein
MKSETSKKSKKPAGKVNATKKATTKKTAGTFVKKGK